MGMAAEDALSLALLSVLQRSGGNFGRHAEPACVHPIDEPRNRLAFEIEFLQFEIEGSAELAEANVIYLKAVELVAVDCDMAKSSIIPDVTLVDAHADEVRHDVGEAVVMIAFDPNDFDVALRI